MNAFAQFSGSGNGTESDPYLIYSATQLYQMNNFLNQPGVVFKLMTDIDLSDFIAENFNDEGWTPIGSLSNPFKGKFLGNNHKITSLTINKPNKDYIGLWGYVSGATISDLKLECQNISGQGSVGCLVGGSFGSTINGISVTNTEIHASSSYLGGIIGYASSTSLKNSSYVGKVIGVGYVGGAIGLLSDGTISNVKSIANVEGSVQVGGCVGFLSSNVTLESIFHIGDLVNSGYYTGGIVGYVSEAATILNCTHRGNIKGESYVGGIIGYTRNLGNTPRSIKSCTVAGNINGLEEAGGIIGFGYGDILPFNVLDCSYSGKLQGTYNVGGIAGFFQGKGSINRCISNGASIKGTGYTGGIIGKNEGVTVQNCFALSRTISASTLDNLGRISGSANANNANNMALVTTKVFSNGVLQSITDDNAKQGQSIGASILKLKATYVAKGWDMEKVWNILETESYPWHTKLRHLW